MSEQANYRYENVVPDSWSRVPVSLKILHILSALDQGGIEKWLVNLTAELQKHHGGAVQSEFMTLLNAGGYYQSTLEDMGCPVHHCQLAWRNLPLFVYQLGIILRRGRYDVVHCHADYLSGLILPVARATGVRMRIGHVHSTEFAFQAPRPLARHLAGRLLRRLQILDGGWCVGTSSAAIDSYLGTLRHQIRQRVCLCGIPCSDYRAAVNTERSVIRQSLNWPSQAKVILHVGRHSEQKNLFFLLEILAAILRRDSKVLCTLAGSGHLTESLQARAKALGIGEKVRFLGSRDDVPRLMRAADLFILPSRSEGLGLVIIEAQAVGLPSLIADVLPPEVKVVEGLVQRLSLSETPEAWTEQAFQRLNKPAMDAQACLAAVEASPFSIIHSARALMALYQESQA